MKLSRFTASPVLAAAAYGMLVAPGAMAADDTDTFDGKIISTTCTVTGRNDLTVNPPRAKSHDFVSVGNTTGATNVTILAGMH